MSRSWTGGSTRAYRRVRAAVLLRDGALCQLQLDGCQTIADQAHHLDGKAMGDDPERMIAACGPCNLKVGDPTTTDPQPQPRTRW